MILSFATEFYRPLGQIDISTAYIQAKGFTRVVYVKTPKEAQDPTGLWKLQSPAYDLVDSELLWYRTSDDALVTYLHLICHCICARYSISTPIVSLFLLLSLRRINLSTLAHNRKYPRSKLSCSIGFT